jgi:hypothetical protein
VVLRAIAIDPDRRYPHAGGPAYDLRRVAMEMGVGDGRLFLRNALQNLMDDTESDGWDDDERPSDDRLSQAPANDDALPRFSSPRSSSEGDTEETEGQ